LELLNPPNLRLSVPYLNKFPSSSEASPVHSPGLSRSVLSLNLNLSVLSLCRINRRTLSRLF